MAKISEDTNVTLDLKTISIVMGGVISLTSMYFVLKSDIALAMEKPEPEIQKVEFEYKDKLVRSTIEKIEADLSTVKEDVNEIKQSLQKVDERLYQISKNR